MDLLNLLLVLVNDRCPPLLKQLLVDLRNDLCPYSFERFVYNLFGLRVSSIAWAR